MSFVKRVEEGNEKIKKELKDEVDNMEKEIKEEQTKPKKKMARRVKTDVQMLRNSDYWNVIENISNSFCAILETPQLADKLSDGQFIELVKAQTEFFNEVRANYSYDDLEIDKWWEEK